MSEPLKGLSEAEVQERVAKGKVNVSKNSNQRSTAQIIRAHTITYFNILNFALAGVVLWTGQWKHALFVGVVFANAIIGIFQELRVKKLIEQLNVITAAKAKVIRSGEKKDIPITEIVEDDLVYVSPGD